MTEGRVFQIKLPMKMKVNKGGEQESLNLNVYRNLHFYKLNFQKKAFQDFVKPLLLGLPQLEAVTLHYEINPKGGSRLDIMNVGSIVDKFFSDALVLNQIIPDDDYKHVVGNSFSFGSVCPTDPHVLVTITETQPRKETPMRILLDQEEIQKALEAFVETMGLSGASGVELSVIGDEIQAEILMDGPLTSNITTTSAPTNTATSDQLVKRRGGRVLGSKNKPKVVISNVAESPETRSDLDGSGDTEGGEEEDSDSTSEGDDQPTSAERDLFGEGSGDGDEEADGTGPSEQKTGINRGNLFGDSDNESSEDTDPDEKGSRAKTEMTTPRKRPSIFDAD